MSALVLYAFHREGVIPDRDRRDHALLKSWVREAIGNTGGWLNQFSLRTGVDHELVEKIIDANHPAFPTPELLNSAARAWRLSIPAPVHIAARRQFAKASAQELPIPGSKIVPRRPNPAKRAEAANARYNDVAKAHSLDHTRKVSQLYRPKAIDECWSVVISPCEVAGPLSQIPLPVSEVPALMGGNYTLLDGHRVALLDNGKQVRLTNLGPTLCKAMRQALLRQLLLRFDNRQKTLSFEVLGERVLPSPGVIIGK